MVPYSQGIVLPEIVCYEKQSNWGGQWNYTVKTGLDEHGEPVHSCMYSGLRINAPKESAEFGDYTFDDHFGKPVSSFPYREDMFDYFQGKIIACMQNHSNLLRTNHFHVARWNRYDVRDKVTFDRLVVSVTFDEDADVYRVMSKDLRANLVLMEEEFSEVICAIGHYSTPHIPIHDGIETFRGRFLHSRDYRWVL